MPSTKTSATRSSKRHSAITLSDVTNIPTRSMRSGLKPLSMPKKRVYGKTRKSQSPPAKIKRTNMEESQEYGQNTEQDSTIQLYDKLRETLGYEYLNITHRLSLDITPQCIENAELCKTQHSRSSAPISSNSNTWQNFPNENRSLLYLNLIEDMCLRGEFPKGDTISKMLELILIINVPGGDDNSEYILQKCALVLNNLLTKFPPCWRAINHIYLEVLSREIDMKTLYPEKSGSNGSIFKVILDILDQTMSESDSNVQKDLNESLDVQGFHDFLKKHSTENRFDLLSRTEKLDRLFLVLHFLTRILELDFSVWVRYHHKPHISMFENAKPLLASVFFYDSYHQITPLVKAVYKVFVNCSCLMYPKDKVQILSRLVSVISVAINISEKPNQIVTYPHVGEKANNITNEIFNAIEDFSGRQINKFLIVIKDIRAPFLRYLLIDKLLLKLEPDRGHMCVKKIHEKIMKKRWEECLPIGPVQHTVNTVKYPTLNSISPKKAKYSDIYQKEYLNLLLDALKSYSDVHELHSVYQKVFCGKKINKGCSNNSTAIKSLKGRLSYPKLEMDIVNVEKSLKLKQKITSNNTAAQVYQNIYVDGDVMLKYRDDIKFLKLLQIKIQNIQNQNLFSEWNEYLSQFFDD